MLYMEDFLEMIEHLPIELRERFTEMREMDLSVQNRVDRLNERQKGFFGHCKKVKVGERDEEFQKIRAEYTKVIEDSSEKIQNAEECYNLVDRYLRKLDQELHKFKLELEADNRGITEILEKRSLEMDNPPPNPAKENRHPKKHGSSSSAGSAATHRKGHQTIAHGSHAGGGGGGGTPSTSSSASHKKSFAFPSDPMLDGTLGAPPGLGPSGSNTYPLQHMGAGGSAIAAAASQAIAATQQFVPGRRTSSLKASYEAINLGVQTHEFSIGRELAGAAQSAIAATLPGTSADGGPPVKRQKSNKRNQNTDPGTSQPMLDVVNSGSLMDESLIDGGLSGSPSTEDLLGGAGGRDGEDWNYDPSEPRYCVCNQVSYGDMVACDNEDCPYEWFHYPCVAITAPPKGKWFCPTCLARRKSGRK